MDDKTATWLALSDCLGLKKGETLMMAAARVYSACSGDSDTCLGFVRRHDDPPDDPLEAVAIAILRSAGYGGAESWERLSRAAELIPRKLHAVPNG